MSMAIRSLHSKVPTIFRYYCRRLKSSVAATSNERVTNPKSGAPVEPYNNLNVDTDVAAPKDVGLRVKLDKDGILHPLNHLGSWVTNSRLKKSPVSKEVSLGNNDHTLKLCDSGMEHADDNASYDHNVEDIIETIIYTRAQSTSQVSNVVVEISKVFPPRLLKRMSDIMTWESFKNNSTLEEDEDRDLQLGFQRLFKILMNSVEANIPVLIDAEDASMQPAIDYLMYKAAVNYHRDDRPLIIDFDFFLARDVMWKKGAIQACIEDEKERDVMVKKAAEDATIFECKLNTDK